MAEANVGLGDDAAGFLSALLAAVPFYVTRVDPEDRIRYINKVVDPLVLETVIGKSVFDFIAPDFHQTARDCFERVRKSGGTCRYESEAGSGDQWATYSNVVSAICDEDGVGLCIIGIDVTEERVRERELERSKEKLRLAVEASGLGMWDLDIASGAVEWNQRLHEIMGSDHALPPEEYFERIPPEDRDDAKESLARVLQEGGVSNVEQRIIGADGELLRIITNGVVVRDEDGKPSRFIGTMQDVTDVRRMEEQLRHAQKIQAVGTLTAGVAHNFNNMLMVMMPALDLLRPHVGSTHHPVVDDARDAARRAADMVRQLMTFAGQRPRPTHRAHGALEIASTTVEMCRKILDRSIELTVSGDEAATIRCDDSLIQQALMNILVNARDAVAEVEAAIPKIEVEVARTEAVPVDAADPIQCVRIAVRDNGPGIDPKLRDRLFEPFFTTKGTRGAGLGLSTSFAIARDHGGWLDCHSEPGAGSEFQLYLPPAKE